MVRGPFGGREGLKKWPGRPLCYCVFQPKKFKNLILFQKFYLIPKPQNIFYTVIVTLHNTLMVPNQLFI